MRTTMAIDDDTPAAAKHHAAREHESVGELIWALARQALAPSLRSPRDERNGVPLLPRRKSAVPVTLELVNQLRDESP